MQNYKYVSYLGSGTYGTTHLYEHTDTKELRAVKCLPRGQGIQESAEFVKGEIMIHMSMNHPNIIKMHEYFLSTSHLCLAMEYASNGDVYELMFRSRNIDETVACRIFRQTLLAVKHCHDLKIAHRDIKIENILLDGDFNAKLCDFGFSVPFSRFSNVRVVGTPSYIAPELLHCNGIDQSYTGEPADVWSLGVSLYVMLYGKYPFDDGGKSMCMQIILDRIMSRGVEFPKSIHISHTCKDLITRILTPRYTQRITLDGIFEHPWVARGFYGQAPAKALVPPPPVMDCDEVCTAVVKAFAPEQPPLIDMTPPAVQVILSR